MCPNPVKQTNGHVAGEWHCVTNHDEHPDFACLYILQRQTAPLWPLFLIGVLEGAMLAAVITILIGVTNDE